MKPMITDYWVLAIICTLDNCAFCEYIISNISVSHSKAEIEREEWQKNYIQGVPKKIYTHFTKEKTFIKIVMALRSSNDNHASAICFD
jgi:hypothetical protein